MTATVEVFDPSMCCSTGICGPSVDPVLPRFAADLEWLAEHGIQVTRHNLAQEPAAFAAAPAAQVALTEHGIECLPLIVVDGRIVSQGAYPTRAELAGWTGLDDKPAPTLYSESVAELVAIGAAIAANCEPCFKYHYDQARKLGVSKEDMTRAVATAQRVKDTPAKAMLELADRYLGVTTPRSDSAEAPESSCCGPTAAPQAHAASEPAPAKSGCCG
jgi:AhpD family alkylhydroperoxidase